MLACRDVFMVQVGFDLVGVPIRLLRNDRSPGVPQIVRSNRRFPFQIEQYFALRTHLGHPPFRRSARYMAPYLSAW